MNISNIACSLSFGNLLDKKQLSLGWIMIVICLFFPVTTVVILFMPWEWNSTETIAIIGGNIFFIPFFLISVYILIKDRILKKKTLQCLEDAVELNAYCEKIDEYNLVFHPSVMKIKVSFVFNKKKIKKESTATVYGCSKGYLGIFKKYADRKVKILYSPKYGEVFILKD